MVAMRNPRLWPARLPCSASRTRKGYLPEGPGLLLRCHSRRSRGVPPVRSLHARLLPGGRASRRRPIAGEAEQSLGPESLTRDRWNRESDSPISASATRVTSQRLRPGTALRGHPQPPLQRAFWGVRSAQVHISATCARSAELARTDAPPGWAFQPRLSPVRARRRVLSGALFCTRVELTCRLGWGSGVTSRSASDGS